MCSAVACVHHVSRVVLVKPGLEEQLRISEVYIFLRSIQTSSKVPLEKHWSIEVLFVEASSQNGDESLNPYVEDSES